MEQNYKTSFAHRSKVLEKVKDKDFDLIVVGGGITGAGILRDAAIRGMKVCLIEKSDFASGTSSRSSKLVHGGLRYLENFEFDLVADALHERQHLLDIVPHMVKPLRFLMPIYKGDRVGMLKMGAGMTLYDSLSAVESTHLHELLGASDIKARYEGIKSKGLKGGFLYSDALMDDDRLVYETLRSASNYGGLSLSYLEATAYEAGKVTCRDHISGEEFVITAKHVISAVGPWTDKFAKLVTDDWQERMRPSKGIHITLPKHILNLDSAVVMGADAQKRILFCIPREGFDIVGTTDTDYKGDASNVYADQADVEYVLKVLKDYYPDIEIKSSDIISTYAGVRPLVNDGSASESKVSRDHWIKTDVKNKVTYISGGKYTTFLAMAEHCVDVAVSEAFSLVEASKFRKQNTRTPFVEMNVEPVFELALKKLMNLDISLTKEERLDLFSAHGPQALSFLSEFYTDGMSLPELEAFIAIHHYFCGSIFDFYSRRVPYILSLKDAGESFLPLVSKVFKEELGLSDAQISDQIKLYKEDVEKRKAGLKF